jgi:hypothetical protein
MDKDSSRRYFIKLIIYTLIIARNTVNPEYILRAKDIVIVFETLYAVDRDIAHKLTLLEILDGSDQETLVVLDGNTIILKDHITGIIIKSIPISDDNLF